MKKREIMRRAQQLRREGMTLSDAMKQAHRELGGKKTPQHGISASALAPVPISVDGKEDFLKYKKDFEHVVKEQLKQAYELRVRYEAELQKFLSGEKIEQYDTFDYDMLMELVNREDKIFLVVSAVGCPDCAYYEKVIDEALKIEPSIKVGTVTLTDEKESEEIAKKLHVAAVPTVIFFQYGKEKKRIIPTLELNKDIGDLVEIWKKREYIS